MVLATTRLVDSNVKEEFLWCFPLAVDRVVPKCGTTATAAQAPAMIKIRSAWTGVRPHGTLGQNGVHEVFWSQHVVTVYPIHRSWKANVHTNFTTSPDFSANRVLARLLSSGGTPTGSRCELSLDRRILYWITISFTASKKLLIHV